MLPTLMDYLDGKEVKDPEEEEDVALVGVMAFFGELHHTTQGHFDNRVLIEAGFETV